MGRLYVNRTKSSCNDDHVAAATGTRQGPAEQVAVVNLAEYHVKRNELKEAQALLEASIVKCPTMNKRAVIKSLTLLLFNIYR
jgi:hypothetical protein